jgi:EAL domain-containing protein (putative c-di-GMP-specific phosphodiesterase class I)
LRNADAAMYRAKESGKANFQFFTNDLNEELSNRLTLRNGLLRALERDELQLFYQPKLELSSGRTTSVEALMRWNSNDLGIVPPSRFIPVLEETGMVVEFGEWAIECVCRQHREWRDNGLPPIRIAINLSARQLREMSFVSFLYKVLEDSGVAAQYLEIEITESMLMADTENAVSALTQLHDLGVRVAMDDFGTGYSSLSHLRRFPIDAIKIDGSFIADMTVSDHAAEIVRTIIGMGKALGMEVVAEGVETGEQVEALRAYGCDEVQGFHISEPAPGDALIGFLHAHAH